MGTSISQGSPNDLNWRRARIAAASPSVPVELSVRELWRAAAQNSVASWSELLSSAGVISCLNLAVSSENRVYVPRRAAQEIGRSRQSSIATDIARRALVRALSREDRDQAFVEFLFIEAANYLVSRDASTQVSPTNRNRNVSDVIAYKRQVADRVRDLVRSYPLPPHEELANGWPDHVRGVIQALSR